MAKVPFSHRRTQCWHGEPFSNILLLLKIGLPHSQHDWFNLPSEPLKTCPRPHSQSYIILTLKRKPTNNLFILFKPTNHFSLKVKNKFVAKIALFSLYINNFTDLSKVIYKLGLGYCIGMSIRREKAIDVFSSVLLWRIFVWIWPILAQ